MSTTETPQADGLISPSSPEVVMVVAASQNGVIGHQGELPWRLPRDLRWFKEQTLGHPVVMGRKTQQALGKPLKGRLNLVISRSHPTALPGNDPANDQFYWCQDLDEALSIAKAHAQKDRVCIIGGGQIYQQAMGVADRILLTRVDAIIDMGDAFFPMPPPGYRLKEVIDRHPPDPDHQYGLQFEDWRLAEQS